MDDLRCMTYKQAMNYLQIKSYTTLYKLIKDGLQTIEINGVRRIDREAIDKYLATKAS